jgi:hypothetical protein
MQRSSGKNPAKKGARKNAFAPWRKDFNRGAFLLAAAGACGALVARVQMTAGDRLGVGATGAVMGVLGFMLLQRAVARRRGKSVESAAAKQLRKVLHKDIPMRESVPLHIGGDADIVVDAKDRYTIEIKSMSSVRVNRKLLGSDVLLNSTTQKTLQNASHFIDQAKRNAEATKGIAVLWFPVARVSTSGVIDGVTVVTGPAAYLAKRCGLRTARWFL